MAPLSSLLCTLALSATLAGACPFHDHSSQHFLMEEDEESTPDSAFHDDHDDHNHGFVRGAKGDSPERALLSGADHRELYPGPHLHRRLPKNFKLCGSKEPSRKERIKLGLTFARFDRKNGFEEGDKGGNQQFIATATQTLLATNVTKIPVIFHNFLKNETYGKLTKKQIKDGLMNTLNKGFRGSGFRFVFKSVQYYINPTWFACDDYTNLHRQTHTGNESTLNVWICNLASKGLGGTAYIPPIIDTLPYLDGVNLMNPALGGSEFAHQAFVHETGHWMGLVHTFVDGCDTEPGYYWDYPDYYFTGDGIKDTAAQAEPTWKYNRSSYCWQNDKLDTCPDAPGADKGLDPIDNYMNYLPAECFRDFGRFTPGQRRRMKAQWLRWRDPARLKKRRRRRKKRKVTMM